MNHKKMTLRLLRSRIDKDVPVASATKASADRSATKASADRAATKATADKTLQS